MSIWNVFKRKMAPEDAKALVWDYLDDNPNATVALMMQDLPEIDANVIKANKRNWQNARQGKRIDSAKPETTENVDTDVKKAKNELEIKKLELEKQKILKELDDAKGHIQAQIEKVRLEADVRMLEDKKQRLDEDIEDAEQELKELETEIDEAEKEAERLNIRLDGDDADPMSMMMQGFMSQAMQKMQSPPTATPPPPVLPASQTTLTPKVEPQPVQEIKIAPDASNDVEKQADEEFKMLPDNIKSYIATLSRTQVQQQARERNIPKDLALAVWKKCKEENK